MFGLQSLDIVIGLIFIYFVLSIICTAANEIIARLFQLRANNLAEGIQNLLSDPKIPNLSEKFFEHPLIQSLCRGTKKPSYIPSKTFALTFIDLVLKEKNVNSRFLSDIRAAVSALGQDSKIGRTMQIFLDEAENDLQKLKASLETWFNEAMDRVSGWYKQKVQVIIFVLGAFIVTFSNADTVQIVKTLSNDPALRQEFSKQVQEFVKQQSAPAPTPSTQGAKEGQPAAPSKKSPSTEMTPTKDAVGGQLTFQEGLNKLQEMQVSGIPMGWKTLPSNSKDWFSKMVGLLLTALAVSLGAPFWFDLLNKVVSIRSVGASPEEKAMKVQKEGTSK